MREPGPAQDLSGVRFHFQPLETGTDHPTEHREKVRSYTNRASCTNQAKAKAPSSSFGVPAAPPAATPYTSAARAASSRIVISPTA